jgi:hypothetical protein
MPWITETLLERLESGRLLEVENWDSTESRQRSSDEGRQPLGTIDKQNLGGGSQVEAAADIGDRGQLAAVGGGQSNPTLGGFGCLIGFLCPIQRAFVLGRLEDAGVERHHLGDQPIPGAQVG